MQQTSPVWKWLWNEGGKNLPPSEYEGDIAAFDNPGYTYPKDITIAIEPVQDLHGQDAPYPAGGGINQWDEEWELGGYNTSTGQPTADTDRIRSKNAISVSPNTKYRFVGGAFVVIWYTVDDTYIDYSTPGPSSNERTSPSNAAKLRFAMSSAYGTTYKNDISINYPSTDTAYHPYSNICPISGWTGANVVVSPTTDAQDGTTYPISWQSEAGTVYGGTLDVTTGLLTVDRVLVDLGTLGWAKNTTYDGLFNGSQLTPEATHFVYVRHICSMYSSVDSTTVITKNNSIAISANGGTVYLHDSAYTDAATFKTAVTGQTLVYELATPQTYQLSPTDVALLLGVNNVWADTGETTVALESPGPMHLETRATIGGTAYADISAPVVNRALMQDSLAVGNVVSASLVLALRSAGSIPRAAAVVIETRLNDGQTASEWLPQGTFYVSRRMRDPVTGALALECYDALLKANAVWAPSAGAWPRTMAAVTAELAALLGVTLDSRTVIPSGAAFAVSEPAAGTTIRDVLSLIAQAAGGNWIMTPAGLMRLARLGEAGGAVDVVGVVGGIDVGAAGVVTGVRSTVDGVVTLTGDDTGIVLDVTVAPVIAAELAEAVIGQAWQPFRLSGAIYDPAAELGDGVRAGAGGEVASALCSEQAAYGPAFRGDIAAPDAGEVTDEYPYIGGAQRTLALAKAAVTEAVNRLDDALTQQEIFNRLTDDGAAQGLIFYNGQLYINASYINAGRLNADYIQGGTLTLGGQNNQNGVLRVLDASGNVITVLNNVGADITDGSVTTYSTDRQTRTILSDGLLKFQYYNSSSQPVGWRDALRLAADPSGATIGTFAGIAELDISGRGRVNISNKAGTTDYDHAEIDMDDDTISLTATNNFDGWTSLEVTKDGVTVTRYDHIGDPRVIFELVDSYEQSDAPLTIGNGGTEATTAAQAAKNITGLTWDLSTNNTSDTWVPVLRSGTLQHRVIPTAYNSTPLSITAGGTGATTAAVTITNNYSSVQNVINAVKNTRSFPISIQKNGTASYSDMPSGYATAEWNLMLIGDPTRLTALMFIFYTTSSGSANQVFSRNFYNGTWDSGWSQIK